MNDEIVIDLQELTKMFVGCPNEECGAEIGFDLERRALVRNLACPVCNREILEVQRQGDVFDFTWVTFFQRLLSAERRPRMRFRIARAAHPEETRAAHPGENGGGGAEAE